MGRMGLVMTVLATSVCVLVLAEPALLNNALMAWRGSSSSGPAASPPSPAGVAQRTIYASGVVEGSQRDVSMRFEVAGCIANLHVHEGDVVRKGDVLAELDAQTAQQRVAEAAARLRLETAERDRLVNGARSETRDVLRADVKTAEVQVQEAEALYTRGKQLFQKKSISAQELDDNRFKYERAVASLQVARARLSEIEAPARQDELSIADARIAVAEATLKRERSLLEKTRLRAPTDGVVLHVLVESGELVAPEDERPLITMTNRGRTRVRAYIEELDALTVSQGQPVHVTADGKPGKKYTGTVLTCSPFVRAKSHRHHKPGELVDVKVREVVIELNDADELVIGLPVDVFIQPAPVPVEAQDQPSRQEGSQPQVSSAIRTGRTASPA